MVGTRLKHILKGVFRPSAKVLMYHRIAAPAQDVWDITVHPALFEQQLQVLKAECQVLPLSDLLERCQKNSLTRHSVAITFDDGYEDNCLVAAPLLEKYGLPATFFIATGNTDTENAFWWDELEELVLRSGRLPASFSLEVAGTPVNVQLEEESVLTDNLKEEINLWRAFVQEPTNQRTRLFLQLWQTLQPLSHPQQQKYLAKIKEWAGGLEVQYTAKKCMSSAQLRALAKNQLFELGGHTITHPLLSSLRKEQQYQELKLNRDRLQQITGSSVKLCSYPYGAYNAESMAVVQEIGYAAAFTTQEHPIHRQSNPFQLGRIQVPNLAEQSFHSLLHYPR